MTNDEEIARLKLSLLILIERVKDVADDLDGETRSIHFLKGRLIHAVSTARNTLEELGADDD